jgi:YhcH/YjgK/YiaL family protein
MFLDHLSNAHWYAAYHPGFGRALAFLADERVCRLGPGRHAVEGERLFVVIVQAEGRGRQEARLETHRRYIDIQLTLGGMEEIGWRAASRCRGPLSEYNLEQDVAFYDDRPELWLAVPAGMFAVFFPHDAHAPLSGAGAVHKAVAKVAIDW